jgi:predicted phosphoribosyltransferase
VFKDRTDAGIQLGNVLKKYKRDNPVVLALPRGGVVVGYEVAKILNSPLDVIISKKIGAPQNTEFGIGAVSEKNAYFIDESNLKMLTLNQDQLDILIKLKAEEVKKKVILFRKGRDLRVKGKTIILVDDGLATGVTAIAAIIALKRLMAKKVIFASPVCDLATSRKFRSRFVSVVCLDFPNISSIGEYYEDFAQVEDEEVIQILGKAKKISS